MSQITAGYDSTRKVTHCSFSALSARKSSRTMSHFRPCAAATSPMMRRHVPQTSLWSSLCPDDVMFWFLVTSFIDYHAIQDASVWGAVVRWAPHVALCSHTCLELWLPLTAKLSRNRRNPQKMGQVMSRRASEIQSLTKQMNSRTGSACMHACMWSHVS